MGGKFEKSDRQLVTSATERLEPKWHTYALDGRCLHACVIWSSSAVSSLLLVVAGRPGGPEALPNAGRFPPPPEAAFGEGNCYNHKSLVFVQQFPLHAGLLNPPPPYG